MNRDRCVERLCVAAALLGLTASVAAHIAPLSTGAATTGANRIEALGARASQRVIQDKISAAARALEQAALQRDFASNEHELALLQEAHDELSEAAKRLHGNGFVRTIDLVADLDHAINRASAPLGSITSLEGDAMIGPPAPSRGQLAQLATEAQDLQRDAEPPHRLLDGTSDESAAATLPGQLATPNAYSLASEDPLLWPSYGMSAWPQIRVRF